MISFSVAVDPNKGIGIKGSLPWHIKEELQVFKANTMNKTILMGQTTYDNLPGSLPGRKVIVVTNNPDYSKDEVEICNDLIKFLQDHQNDETEYIVCGGASIYRQSYPYASKAYVSFIKKEYEVDTKFEIFNLDDWNITKEIDHELFIERELKRKDA